LAYNMSGLKYCMGCSLVDVCIVANRDLLVNEKVYLKNNTQVLQINPCLAKAGSHILSVQSNVHLSIGWYWSVLCSM